MTEMVLICGGVFGLVGLIWAVAILADRRDARRRCDEMRVHVRKIR